MRTIQFNSMVVEAKLIIGNKQKLIIGSNIKLMRNSSKQKI